MASTTPIDSNAVTLAFGYVKMLEAQLEDLKNNLNGANSDATQKTNAFNQADAVYTDSQSSKDKAKTFCDNADAVQTLITNMVSFYETRDEQATIASMYASKASDATLQVTETMHGYAVNVETSVNLANAYNDSEDDQALHFTDQVLLNNYSSADTKAQDTLSALTAASLDSLDTVWKVSKLDVMINFFENDLTQASEMITKIQKAAAWQYNDASEKEAYAKAELDNAKAAKDSADKTVTDLNNEISMLEEMIKTAKSGLSSASQS